MDFWASFAAASAEYLGKNKQNSLKNEISSSVAKESKASKADDQRFKSRQSADFFSSTDSIPWIGGEISPGFDEYTNDKSTILSLQPWIVRKESYFDVGEGSITSEGQYPRRTRINPGNIAPVSACARSKSYLRSRKARRISIKTSKRTENSLIPQLYGSNFEIEDSPVSPLPSPASTPVRPFLVTDGNRIISKSSSDQVTADPNLKTCRSKRRCEEAVPAKLNSFNSQKFSQSSESVGNAYFFSLGVCVGVASALLSSKREIDRINDMLKQRDNLVQDLKEELVMKDSPTVCEVVEDSLKTQENKNIDVDVEEKIYSSPKFESNSSSPKPQEEIQEESMSVIEAELEAELEKLELSMNATSLEGRLSSLTEVEPEFDGDIVHGELRVEIGGSGDATDHPGGGAISPPVNYAVSPRQLSLRLHELIQSRLEDRIKELETMLRQPRQQVGGDATTVLSATSVSGDHSPEMGQPLCLNLAGDALEAYHEAYEEFQKPDEVVVAADQGAITTATPLEAVAEEETPVSSEHESVWSLELGNDFAVVDDDDDGDDDDDDSDEDEDERMLIQQVLERARKGSPAVLNAQKMLSLGVVDCPWTEDL